jgi:hypothetical protein
LEFITHNSWRTDYKNRPTRRLCAKTPKLSHAKLRALSLYLFYKVEEKRLKFYLKKSSRDLKEAERSATDSALTLFFFLLEIRATKFMANNISNEICYK